MSQKRIWRFSDAREERYKIYATEKHRKKSLENQCELSAIKIADRNIILINTYRPRMGNLEIFFDTIATILNEITQKNQHIILVGDINIDYLTETETKSELEHFFMSYKMSNLIRHPTRITEQSSTCLDHCFTNIQ